MSSLMMSTTLGRDTLQRTIVESKKATGGTPPPERDWEDVVRAIQTLDEPTLALFLTNHAQSGYSRSVPDVKWNDEVTPGTRAAAGPK